jgi:NADH:ubiquinone oxidoreductase subunit K
LTKPKLASVLALIVVISVILTVGGLFIVAAEPLGSPRTAAAEFPLAITVAAALTLVTLGVMTVLRRRRQTRTGNRNQYTLRKVNFGAVPWQGAQDAFEAIYCDKCGNRLSRLYQETMAYHKLGPQP